MEEYAIYLPLYEERTPKKLEDLLREFSQDLGFFMQVQVASKKVTFLQTIVTSDTHTCKTYVVPLTAFCNPKCENAVSAVGTFASRFNRMSSIAFSHNGKLKMTLSVEENGTKKFKGAKKVLVARLEYDSGSDCADISLLLL